MGWAAKWMKTWLRVALQIRKSKIYSLLPLAARPPVRVFKINNLALPDARTCANWRHLPGHSFPTYMESRPPKLSPEGLMIHHGWSRPRIAYWPALACCIEWRMRQLLAPRSIRQSEYHSRTARIPRA